MAAAVVYRNLKASEPPPERSEFLVEPSGIHLLMTYKCNARCAHCFLSCGPERGGLITLSEAEKYLVDLSAAPYLNHFFIEGGEPFLYPELLKSLTVAVTGSGYWVGALTNGFWAVTDAKAREVLEPLAAAGLSSLGVSTDAWHNQFVPVERAERAVRVAADLGMEADLMVCAGGPDSETVLTRLKKDGFDIFPSRVICRGRASTNTLCHPGMHDWQDLTECSARFGGRSRIHLGPDGQIHLCQGLLLGQDARKRPLTDIFAKFKVENHPLCSALISSGPAQLARLAIELGFVPEAGYADGCQLCFEARRYLQPFFPELVGPSEMYSAVLIKKAEGN